jgi:transposase
MSLYVYAFVDAPGAVMRISGRRIEILPVKGVHVAVERMEGAPRASEAFLLAQHSIVDRLWRAFEAVLPARFGAWHEPAALSDMVASQRRELREGLRRVRGRAQMTIRIISPVAPGQPSPEPAPSGTAYLTRRKAALSQRTPSVVDSIRAAVKPFVAEERLDVVVDRGRTAVYHLISRGDARLYRSRVSRITAREQDAIAVGGPYAAYAFAPEMWR